MAFSATIAIGGEDMKKAFAAGLLACTLLLPSIEQAQSVEGQIGLYLLGSRDLAMGIVPKPGWYFSNDTVFLQGKANAAASAFGGAVVGGAIPDVDVIVQLPSITRVFNGQVFGGTFAVNAKLPYADAEFSGNGTATLPSGATVSGTLNDSYKDFGDLTITPMIGWHRGKFHYSFAASIYAPTADYSTATLNPLHLINPSKNRWAIDPTLSMTYLDPATGLELDGSFGVTISETNDATDYKSGAEFHFEGTIAKRFFKAGVAVGVTGYVYRQIENDSGAGAQTLKTALGNNDIKSRINGFGPVLSYSKTMNGVSATITGKYIKQFDQKNYFEGDSAWLRLTLGF